jgi:RNase H-fold protein (predicted Holliday junction resolvase)
MVTAPHILALDPGARECGVAVFAGASLLYFATKILTRQVSADALLLQVKRLTTALLVEYQPDVVILSHKRLPSPTIQAVARQMRRTAQAHALTIQQYTLADAQRTICASRTATRQEVIACLIARFPALRHYTVQPTKWQIAYRQRMFAAIAAGVTHLARHQ